MTSRTFLLLLVALAALTAGCIFGGGGGGTGQVTYVTPCNVIGKGIMFRVNDTLSAGNVQEPLAHDFADDITSDQAEALKRYYGLSCYWGMNTGEIKNHYYCNGSYVAPDVNEQGVITRNLRKMFKIGFSVDAFEEMPWRDMNGVTHQGSKYYDMTVDTVEAKCTVA
jgi:hypothetical protein